MNIGIHYNLPFSAYAKDDAVNQTRLKLMEASAKKFHYFSQTTKEDTPVFGTGRALHTLVLEPDQFNSMFVQQPELNLRTNDGKAQLAQFKAANPGKEVLKGDEYAQVFEIAGAILGHPDCCRLLTNTVREVSLFWQDEETGVKCKGRLDAWRSDTGTVVDVKTTKDASPRGFARAVWQYGYGLQAAWYFAGMRALGLHPQDFVLIAVEKEPPYDIGVYRLSDDTIKLSQAKNAALLRRYAECKRKDYWPGYTEGIVDIGVPKFGLEELEANYGESI